DQDDYQGGEEKFETDHGDSFPVGFRDDLQGIRGMEKAGKVPARFSLGHLLPPLAGRTARSLSAVAMRMDSSSCGPGVAGMIEKDACDGQQRAEARNSANLASGSP
nr:hypothetical protein [Gammaproteobacteria bacterium]